MFINQTVQIWELDPPVVLRFALHVVTTRKVSHNTPPTRPRHVDSHIEGRSTGSYKGASVDQHW